MVLPTENDPGLNIVPRRALVVFLLYFALTVALLVPFSLHLSTRALSPGSDWNFTLWVFDWDVWSIFHRPWAVFDANIMAPLPNTLGYEENAIGSALMAAPILWLTHNLLLATNLAVLLTIPLSGLGVYVLGRKLGMRDAGAILAGLVFALDPPRFFRIEQFHITAIQWIPFCLAYIHAYLDGGRRRDLWMALGFFSLQALASGHGASFLLVSILALLGFRFALGEPIALVRRVRDVGIAGLLLLLPAVLIYVPYHRARSEAGLVRDLRGWFTAPASFFATPSRIDSAITAHFPLWLQESPNAYLFPGYVLLLFLASALFVGLFRPTDLTRTRETWLRRLATTTDAVAFISTATAIWIAWFGIRRWVIADDTVITMHRPWRLWLLAAGAAALRLVLLRRVPAASPRDWWLTVRAWRRANRRNAALLYGLLTLAGVALLVGPPFGVWQFVYWIPPLSFIRAPLRFSLLMVLGLSVASGLLFERWTNGWSRRARTVAASLLCVALVVEFAAIPITGEPETVEIPSIDRWLNTQPKPFTIAEVPLASPADVSRFNAESARYMVHTIAHHQKTVMGFTGVLPPDHALLYEQLSRFPDEDGLKHLLAFHTTYVVIHGDEYSPEAFAALEAGLHQFGDWLTLVHAEGRECVYAIHAPGGPRPR